MTWRKMDADDFRCGVCGATYCPCHEAGITTLRAQLAEVTEEHQALKERHGQRVDQHDVDGKALMEAREQLAQVTEENERLKKDTLDILDTAENSVKERDEAREQFAQVQRELEAFKGNSGILVRKIVDLKHEKAQVQREAGRLKGLHIANCDLCAGGEEDNCVELERIDAIRSTSTGTGLLTDSECQARVDAAVAQGGQALLDELAGIVRAIRDEAEDDKQEALLTQVLKAFRAVTRARAAKEGA